MSLTNEWNSNICLLCCFTFFLLINVNENINQRLSQNSAHLSLVAIACLQTQNSSEVNRSILYIQLTFECIVVVSIQSIIVNFTNQKGKCSALPVGMEPSTFCVGVSIVAEGGEWENWLSRQGEGVFIATLSKVCTSGGACPDPLVWIRTHWIVLPFSA